MRWASVCSGIGAPEVAWGGIFGPPVYVSEIAKFPAAVLKHHYPEVPNLGDFTQIQSGCGIELLVGGTPCQDFSVAGLRAGLAGDRGNLTLEFLRLVGRERPCWVVWENVPGVFSVDGGRAFGAFLGGLEQLGYGWAYRTFDAQYAGVPQRRRRVFVVGHLGDWRPPAAVLFERHSLQGHSPPSREEGQRVTACLESGANRSGGPRPPGTTVDTAESLVAGGLTARYGKGPDSDATDALVFSETGSGWWAEGIAPLRESQACKPESGIVASTLKANSGRNQIEATYIAHTLRAEGFDAGEDGTGRGTPLVPVAFDLAQITHPENRATVQAGQPAPSLSNTSRVHVAAIARTVRSSYRKSAASGDGSADPEVIAYQCHGSNFGPLGTLRTGNGVGAGVPFALEATAVRRLTPRECERLQGFPDDWTAITYRKRPAKDGPRYQALGNSMCVNDVRWIGERIAQVGRVLRRRARAA